MVKQIVSLLAIASIALAQTVDLGYAKYSVTKDYINVNLWSNIRYAAPPIGSLRFAPPAAPLTEDAVNDGSIGYTCPQAAPENGLTGGLPPLFSDQNEDCLFLDVYAPANITETANLPVMFWIYGGGYTDGTKDDYPGFGIIQASGSQMIYVAANYRLGAFGFSAGPTFGQHDGTANVGLLDQKAALEWTKAHIRSFGGNPDQITVAGESAGASSIMFHMTSTANTKLVFNRAIAQSPAFLPLFQPTELDEIYANFTILAGCSNPSSGTELDCLRSAPMDRLISANKEQINHNPVYGTSVYGPSVDYGYVHGLPTIEILRGNAPKIPMLLSFVGNESAIFVNPDITTDAQFDATINAYLPDIAAMNASNTAAFLSSIDSLYPSVSFSSEYARLSQLVDDVLVGCNVYSMATHNPSSSYVYEFDVGEAHHGSDILYTFYNAYGYRGLTSAQLGVENDDIAKILQAGLASFVMTGSPGFSAYGQGAAIKILGDSGVQDAVDPNRNARCSFWVNASYDPASSTTKSVDPSIFTTTTASGTVTGTSASAMVPAKSLASGASQSQSPSSGSPASPGSNALHSLSFVTLVALFTGLLLQIS